LPTFALEMSYLKAGEMKQGWLFDTNKVTEIYFFIFSIHLFNPLETMNHENDIQSCEVVLVNRIRLLNELSKKGLDFQECTRINDLLRAEKVKTRIVFAEGFNFQISNQIEEKPVNLIVRKKFLESIGKKYVFKRINLQLV